MIRWNTTSVCVGIASVVWCGCQHDQMEHYISRSLVYSLLWSIAGDGRLKVRQDLGEFIRGVSTIPMPQATEKLSVIDYEACVLLCINSAQCCCCSMVLGLESYSKRTKDQHPFCQKSSCGCRNDEDKPLVGVLFYLSLNHKQHACKIEEKSGFTSGHVRLYSGEQNSM